VVTKSVPRSAIDALFSFCYPRASTFEVNAPPVTSLAGRMRLGASHCVDFTYG
jgi:hypothetical protein